MVELNILKSSREILLLKIKIENKIYIYIQEYIYKYKNHITIFITYFCLWCKSVLA